MQTASYASWVNDFHFHFDTLGGVCALLRDIAFIAFTSVIIYFIYADFIRFISFNSTAMIYVIVTACDFI